MEIFEHPTHHRPFAIACAAGAAIGIVLIFVLRRLSMAIAGGLSFAMILASSFGAALTAGTANTPNAGAGSTAMEIRRGAKISTPAPIAMFAGHRGSYGCRLRPTKC